MSLTAIEDEARSIIKEAEKKAEEILAKARKEAEEIRRREVKAELPAELVKELEKEFTFKLSEAKKNHNVNVSKLREKYAEVKEEIVNEYLKLVLGL